ncbi:unnamed protein product [Allacma fusca]|uniref:Uncharacterized protein n=1 Tax=Allacma fusca TaxID=39272 RepID=A0A8J2KDB4_9HEXA|nr:unnamed protein product [Allacma fusca]
MGAVLVALVLLMATDLAEGAVDPYGKQQPPFNGGIFGKRNSGGIRFDAIKIENSWRSVCRDAMETCASVFTESS